jgi:hypothetical protein
MIHLKNNVHIRDTWSHLVTGLKTNKYWDGILRYGTAATHRSNYLKHIEVSSILIVRRSLTESAHAESEDMQVLTPG